MDANFKEPRRKDRVLTDEQRIKELLETTEYGFLSLGRGENGYAYGIPLSYAYDKETHCLYFHCAPEGYKLELMKQNNKVSFCLIGNTQPVPKGFTTFYESVLAFGTAIIELDEDEKRKALRLLVKKYSPGFEELGEKYMNGSWDRTNAFKIKIDHISAKAKYKMSPHMKDSTGL